MNASKFLATVLAISLFAACARSADSQELKKVIRSAQTKVAKIYGAGGLRQLEAYQSGILVSPEGHVLTALSYVLDTDDLAVILHDGSKWEAEYLGSDPISDIALLKLSAKGLQLPHFDLRNDASLVANPGQRILALSNLYGIATGDEPVSVLQGVVTAIAPLRARRGAYQSNYNGDVYVLDAYANNPGAAGGALIDWQGRLLGILGKELRSELTGTWLNYALPSGGLANTVEALKAGRLALTPPAALLAEEAHRAEALGISLIPNVLPRTPPYVDGVRRDSAAEVAGIRVDDLIVFVERAPVESHKACKLMLKQLDATNAVKISVLRDGKLREFLLKLAAPEESNTGKPAAKAPEEVGP